MPIPTEITDILSEFGVPAGAIALAVGLVRGAKALEEDASDVALKYVSGLLMKGGADSVGKLGTTLVPVIFDRIFGSRPFSLKFLSRSVFATTLFWLVLLSVKHADWSNAWQEATNVGWPYIGLLSSWYILDWVSLIKAKMLISLLLKRYTKFFALLFFVSDIILSYTLALLLVSSWYIVIAIFVYIYYHADQRLSELAINGIHNTVMGYLELNPILSYVLDSGEKMTLVNVVIPSTMLTSLWTFSLMVSGIIAQLLAPIDYLRRFTAWWFRDIDKHPLTAIAKVAGTLIIIGAGAIKAIHSFGA